jgi:hypothetical protein
VPKTIHLRASPTGSPNGTSNGLLGTVRPNSSHIGRPESMRHQNAPKNVSSTAPDPVLWSSLGRRHPSVACSKPPVRGCERFPGPPSSRIDPSSFAPELWRSTAVRGAPTSLLKAHMRFVDTAPREPSPLLSLLCKRYLPWHGPQQHRSQREPRQRESHAQPHAQ